MMSKKIEFIAVHEWAWDLADKPYPAQKNIPNWWRNMPNFIVNRLNPDGDKLIINNSRNNLSPKKCMPMHDAISDGYIIPLWADIQVRNNMDFGDVSVPEVSWKSTKEVFEGNVDGSDMLSIPEGYSEYVFKFINLWCIRTPPGYSTRISAPINNGSSPFVAFDAIVDTDKYDAALPIPVLMKKDFEGVVKRGTPMAQVTPFKRDNWKAEFDYYPDGVHSNKHEDWLRFNLFGNYIKTQWSKKSFK